MDEKSTQSQAQLVPKNSTLAWIERPLARLRTALILAKAQRQAVIAGLFVDGGLVAACQKAGITVADAIAERVRNSRFRAQWQAVDSARLEAAETLIIDGLMEGLSAADPTRLPDKATISLWKSLITEKRRHSSAISRPTNPAPNKAGPEVVSKTDVTAEDRRADELVQWFNRQIAEQEARLGVQPDQ